MLTREDFAVYLYSEAKRRYNLGENYERFELNGEGCFFSVNDSTIILYSGYCAAYCTLNTVKSRRTGKYPVVIQFEQNADRKRFFAQENPNYEIPNSFHVSESVKASNRRANEWNRRNADKIRKIRKKREESAEEINAHYG